MFRTTLFSLLTLGLTSSVFAQSSLDNFQFPEINDKAKSTSDSESRKQKLVSSSAAQNTPGIAAALAPEDAPIIQSEINDPITNSRAVPNQYSGMPQPQMYEPFNGYMSYGPSPISPMQAYMVCSQNACPNLWAGFAAEHAARMAHLCSKHGCSHCECNESVGKKKVHNRYKKTAEVVSEPCDQK